MESLKIIIQDKVLEIEKDKRFNYTPASVLINAPLAIIQVGLKTKHNTYSEILNIINQM